MRRQGWVALVLSALVVGCTRPSETSPPRVAPTTAPILGCDLAQHYVMEYRRTAGTPRVWETLIVLQGGNADGGMALVASEPDPAGRCTLRWVGTLHGRSGSRAQLTWWYAPRTGEVQAADASTTHALGW